MNYNPDNWKAIQNYLLNPKKYSLFDIATRVRFIHDIFALAEAEKLSYTFLFNTMKYLKHEEHNLPLRVALDEFDILYSRSLRSYNMHRLLKVSRIVSSCYFNAINEFQIPFAQCYLLKNE